MLGICRGAQVLNVAAGGTLVQDVPSTGTELVHTGEWVRVIDDPPSSFHEIEVLAGDAARRAGSAPASTSSTPTTTRPSTALGEGLRTAAVAPDGTIEATESTNGAYAVGLQWHNEFHMRADERYARPLQALVEAARA